VSEERPDYTPGPGTSHSRPSAVCWSCKTFCTLYEDGDIDAWIAAHNRTCDLPRTERIHIRRGSLATPLT
jgi:hypothetical protein